MLEYEDTGSEGTDAGKDDCTKSERGGSEEESGHKDSGDEEGNQMFDSQQVQVASVREIKDERNQKEAGEVENDHDGNTETNPSLQNELLLSESLDGKGKEKHGEARITDETPMKDQRAEGEPQSKSEGEHFTTVHIKPENNVSERSDETQQRGGGVQDQDELHRLVSGTPQKVPAETQSSLSAQAEGCVEEAKVTSTSLTE